MCVYRFLRFSIFFMFVVPLTLYAQIPNGGFEAWTEGMPNEWLTNNVPTVITPITQSSSNRSGSFAVRGEVLTFGDAAYPPLLYSSEGGFSIDQKYEYLNGYYQFSPVGGDQLYIFVAFFNNFTPIASGEAYLEPTTSNYTQFSIPIESFSALTPDGCIIEIIITDTLSDNAHVGSVFLLDDLSLSGEATSVTNDLKEFVPEAFSLEQNYPNPFNPSTTIEYTITEAGMVQLDIFTELGEYVMTLVNGRRSAGQYTVQWQPKNVASGVYIYRLTTNKGIQTRKMLFMK